MASLLRTASRSRPAFSRCIAQRVPAIALRRQHAAASAGATITESGEQPYFPNEPTGPSVQTAIPGPKSTKAIERLSKVFDTRSLNMMTNYQQSLGN